MVLRDDHALLAQRGKAPDLGKWGFPGGHVELGETAMAAAMRELREETGVIATPVRYLTNIDVLRQDDQGRTTVHYLLAAVLCDYVSGTPHAADDVTAAAWVSLGDIAANRLLMSDRVQGLATLARRSLRDRTA